MTLNDWETWMDSRISRRSRQRYEESLRVYRQLAEQEPDKFLLMWQGRSTTSDSGQNQAGSENPGHTTRRR